MLRRSVLALLCLALPLGADVLVLNDGRKLSGSVKEKADGYEITVEGQTLAFNKEDVAKHIKSPKDLTGDAEKNYEDAKKIYIEAVDIQDEKKAEARFREALPKVVKAREAYAEARDLFPEGHPDLDEKLVNVMKLMRLVRERLTSQIAAGEVRTPAAAEPVVVVPKEAPVVPKPVVEAKTTSSAAEAFAILVDPAKRADPAVREGARALFKATRGDFAMAGYVFLSRDDYEWGLVQDVADLKGTLYKGRVRGQTLITPEKREIQIKDAKVTTAVPSEAFTALQEYFKAADFAKIETLDDAAVAEGVKFLSLKSKELKGKGQDVDVLGLFSGGLASALIAKNKGQATKELEASFKDLGWEKSEYGAVWGSKVGLAMDDYRKWMASGEYGLAVVQFQSEYKSVVELNVRYALGLLMTLKALADNRHYSRAASYLEVQSRTTSTNGQREHLLALAKSVRENSPCAACGGTAQVNCATCKGKVKINVQCGKCGGSGQINSLRGIVGCTGCNRQGTFKNVDCPKCKPTPGKVDCKARGCDKPVKPPKFESFADAYKCGLCKGLGSVLKHAAYPCPECSGIGLILQPKADPTKLLK